jgi:Uma2 family endonuclease
MKAMSTGTTTKLMTGEEFCDWVQQPGQSDRWFELVRGEVIELPPPAQPHGILNANIARILGNHAFQRRKGFVASDSGVLLDRDPDTVRGPDVAYYESAKTFREAHPKYGEIPPRLAVEILSPNDRANQVMRKITDYLQGGVALVWVVDPEAETVTIYQPDKTPRTRLRDQEITGEDVLPGFSCKVADFFILPEDDLPTEPKGS